MKGIINKIALIAAALMIMSVSVLAEDLYMGAQPSEPQMQQGGKDECLLVATNCGNQAMSIQNRIDSILNEIKKGTSIYTNEELNILQKRLEDANKELNEAYEGGA